MRRNYLGEGLCQAEGTEARWLRDCEQLKEAREKKASSRQHEGFKSRHPTKAELSELALGVSRLCGHVVCAVAQRPTFRRAPCLV